MGVIRQRMSMLVDLLLQLLLQQYRDEHAACLLRALLSPQPGHRPPLLPTSDVKGSAGILPQLADLSSQVTSKDGQLLIQSRYVILSRIESADDTVESALDLLII